MKDRSLTGRMVPRTVCMLLVLAFSCAVLLVPGTVKADEYDPQQAGHPLKILAYLAFPIGTLLDYGLMRPAYWVVQREPFATIFGYNYMAYDDEKVHQDPVEQMAEQR